MAPKMMRDLVVQGYKDEQGEPAELEAIRVTEELMGLSSKTGLERMEKPCKMELMVHTGAPVVS